jgi:hypothetical protein
MKRKTIWGDGFHLLLEFRPHLKFRPDLGGCDDFIKKDFFLATACWHDLGRHLGFFQQSSLPSLHIQMHMWV